MTEDRFVAVVPVDDHRCIVVYRRRVRGREYLRLRYWHCHRSRAVWYPDSHKNGPRAFMLPAKCAGDLAQALSHPGDTQEPLTAYPNWLSSREDEAAHRIAVLSVLGAPESLMRFERRRGYPWV